MIRIENLKKVYGTKTVLDIDVLEIPAGEVFGLVGNNGAGKTTLFSLILDLIKPSAGAVYSKEQQVARSEDWKMYTTAFLDESFLINFLTPDEYFQFIGKLYNWNKKDVDQFVAQFSEFFNNEIIGVKKYIRDLSKGNQKKTGLVAALIGNPEIVVLDEPFSNLDPTSQIRLKKIIEEHSQGKTFLISSHDLNHIADVCERIVILENGQVKKDLIKSEQTMEELSAYFSV